MATEEAKRIDDGGNAFPVASYDVFQDGFGGMNLRTYVAVHAMQGILASGPVHRGGEAVVREAVIFADALIAELAKK